MLNPVELHHIGGGCPDDSCQAATLNLLNDCNMTQLREINQIFKKILQSEEMQNADDATKIAALIAAIQNATF
jgi:hypothetical protein